MRPGTTLIQNKIRRIHLRLVVYNNMYEMGRKLKHASAEHFQRFQVVANELDVMKHRPETGSCRGIHSVLFEYGLRFEYLQYYN